MPERRTVERILAAGNGFFMLFLGLLLLIGAVLCLIGAAALDQPLFGIGVVACAIAGILALRGLVIVNPNEGKVVIFFGRYVGSIVQQGFFWVNPFTVRKRVSMRVHNFTSDTLKVNDDRGNPVEIAAVVVWRVRDTAQAMFDVEDYWSYVSVQSEAAVRQIASHHPYDSHEEEGQDESISLRGSAQQVNEELRHELTERLQLAGIEVLEARLSHLAYAPEIAGAMLQRQQAEAIIAARTRIVDGAVGMVEMALQHLERRGVVNLDEERKAAMVSNLLVVLCSERGSQPVLSAGMATP